MVLFLLRFTERGELSRPTPIAAIIIMLTEKLSPVLKLTGTTTRRVITIFIMMDAPLTRNNVPFLRQEITMAVKGGVGSVMHYILTSNPDPFPGEMGDANLCKFMRAFTERAKEILSELNLTFFRITFARWQLMVQEMG